MTLKREIAGMFVLLAAVGLGLFQLSNGRILAPEALTIGDRMPPVDLVAVGDPIDAMIDPPALEDGECASSVVQAPLAKLGDTVSVAVLSGQGFPNGVLVAAHSELFVVVVKTCNASGRTVNLSPYAVKILVMRERWRQ